MKQQVEYHSTIGDIKQLFHRVYPQLYPTRQALKLHPKSAELRDEELLQNLPVGTIAMLYLQDLGPRFGWTMVFLSEYVGPLLIYLLFYFRLPYIYTHTHTFTPPGPHPVVSLACVCHTLHYIKRLMETVFVHHFTHGTLPVLVIIRIRNYKYFWPKRTVCITGVLLRGWHITLITHFTLHHLMDNHRSPVHSSRSCCVRWEISLFTGHSTPPEQRQEPNTEVFLIPLKTPSLGFSSLFPAPTIHMRLECG